MATSPPGFTSPYESKHRRAYREMESILIPSSGADVAESSARSTLLKARVALARIEAEILRFHKELREGDLSPQTIESKAPSFAREYLEAFAKKESAQRAYTATMPPASRATGSLNKTTPSASAVFKGLVAGRKRTTRKHRNTRNGHAQVRRHTRGRLSHRKVKA